MRATFSWLLGAILLLAIPGCDKGEDHILEGRKAVKAGNFEKGIEHFDNALKANPSSYDAMWGKADAYRRDNNLVKQAEVLEQISANKDMIEKFAAVVTPRPRDELPQAGRLDGGLRPQEGDPPAPGHQAQQGQRGPHHPGHPADQAG
jgi:tetratricopeptide (TPR) repeat protein